MLKNYNYILTIVLYPFILILSYFLLINKLEGSLYLNILLFMLVIFIPSFIMTLYGISEDILNSKKKWRIILLILFSIFYIPIYYTKNITKQEVYIGFIISIVSITFSGLVYHPFLSKTKLFFDSLYLGKVGINEQYTYTSNNNLIRIDVDKTFVCSSNNGDYVISCDRKEDDSFIGIYYYDITDYSDGKIKDIFDYHLEQIVDVIIENNYEYKTENNDSIVKIYYNDMVVLLSQNNYIVGDGKYCLIIVKEVPKKLMDEKEYQKMIESIVFLNYNNGVSS